MLKILENFCSGTYKKEPIMLTKEMITQRLRAKYPYLVSEYGIRRIGLFGSYSRGEQTEDSDVDIIAEFERPIGLRFVGCI